MTIELLIRLTAVLCVSLASFAIAGPNECKPFVHWYAELYPDNPGFIKVTVDTQGIAEGLYIDNVSFNATFYDGRNQYIAQGSFNFPDEQIQGLSRGFYVAYLPHSHKAAQSAKGREIEFLCKTKGLAFNRPRDKVPASAAELERVSDAASTVVGNVPERTNAAPEHTASTRSASDFAGFWRNQDPSLRFIQFLRVVATGPNELQIEAWLRCQPTPGQGGTMHNCQRWGPDRATLTTSGEVTWIHSGDPVGRNVLTLEGSTLKVFTRSPGWSNYFGRAR